MKTQEVSAWSKLGAAASTLKGRADVQRRPSAGKVGLSGTSWSSVKAVTSCSVCVLEYRMHRYRLGDNWIESSFAENDLGGPHGQ